MKGAVIEKKRENGKYRYVLTDLSGTTSTFDQDGNLTAYEDVSGNKTKFTYDDNHRMLTCINADGVTVVENTYDDKGRVLSQVEAGSEKKSVFTYEETKNGGQITKIKKHAIVMIKTDGCQK